MPGRNWYEILGIRAGADLAEIRRAYRHAAFSAHPDVSQPPDPERFRDIHEAYQVLSDPQRRRAYDLSIGREDVRRAIGPTRPGRHSRDINNWFNGGPWCETRHGPTAWERPDIAGAGARLPLRLEAILDPEEARLGCRVPFTLTFTEPYRLSGNGARGGRRTLCGGAVAVESSARITLEIPPGVHSGQRLRAEVGNLALEIRIAVR